jgi:hypothetical protein
MECTTVQNVIGVYKATKRTGKDGVEKTTAYLFTKPETLPQPEETRDDTTAVL